MQFASSWQALVQDSCFYTIYLSDSLARNQIKTGSSIMLFNTMGAQVEKKVYILNTRSSSHKDTSQTLLVFIKMPWQRCILYCLQQCNDLDMPPDGSKIQLVECQKSKFRYSGGWRRKLGIYQSKT